MEKAALRSTSTPSYHLSYPKHTPELKLLKCEGDFQLLFSPSLPLSRVHSRFSGESENKASERALRNPVAHTRSVRTLDSN